MATTQVPKLLINLVPGFFTSPATVEGLKRARGLATVRQRSWDTPDEIREDLAWADAVLMNSWPVIDASLLSTSPSLRFSGNLDIQRPAAELLLQRGIPVSLAKGCWSPAVAEMALGLVLGSLRRITHHQRAMAAGTEVWVKDFPSDVDPRERELTGARVGLIGFGAVGRRFIELLVPFRCQVRVFDPFVAPEVVASAGATSLPLEEVLSGSDIVFLCAAANKGSAHLIDRTAIGLIPPGGILVNVARAALIDHAALIERLERGDLHAALDVFDREPLAPEARLRALPNALLTPHRAGGILPSIARGLNMLLDDFESHLAGRPLARPLLPRMLTSLDG